MVDEAPVRLLLSSTDPLEAVNGTVLERDLTGETHVRCKSYRDCRVQSEKL